METCEEVLNILSPKPLRISKQRLKIESLVNSASCDALRCFIPRRHSASSIRCKADYISSSRIPLLEGPEEIPQTTKTGNRGPSLLLQPSPILAFSDMPMGRVHLEKNPELVHPEADHIRQQIPPKHLISRAVHAFDAKLRQFSKGTRYPTAAGPIIRISPNPRLLKEDTKEPRPDLKKDMITVLGEAMDARSGKLREILQERAGQLTPPLSRADLHVAKNRTKSSARSPQRLPITIAQIEFTMDALKMGTGGDHSDWVAVEVTAEVNDMCFESHGQVGGHIPLDAMILMDNSMSWSLLKGACRNAYLVASALDVSDRLAVGCTSLGSCSNLKVLLPLQFCNLDVTGELFRSPLIFQPHYHGFGHVDLSNTLTEASNFLARCSSRGALCHIFFLTASSGASLSGRINHRVRLHTISPEPKFRINTSNVLEGWHLITSFETDNDFDAERPLTEKIKLVIRHLRMGVDSGVLSELSMTLQPAIGCTIEALLGETNCSTLRPGEIWTTYVKVKAAIGSTKNLPQDGPDYYHYGHIYKEDVENMIDQLQEMLKPATSRTQFQTIVRATLQYSHSSLPGPAVVKVEKNYQVMKPPQSGSRYDTADLQSSKSGVRNAWSTLPTW